MELATLGEANCFANAAAPRPVLPVVTTVTLDPTTFSAYTPSGFNSFLQYVPLAQLVLGESVLPGEATLQGVVGTGPTIGPVATQFCSIELVAN